MNRAAKFADIARSGRKLVSPVHGKFNLFIKLRVCYTQNVSLTSPVQH